VAGVPYVVAGGQDEGAVVVFEVLGMGNLFDEDSHEPDGMGGRAGASFLRTNRVRDMVLEVGTRSILTIPAGRKQDLDANTVGTVSVRECVRFWDGRFVEAEAMVIEGLVRRIRAHRTPGRRACDHAKAWGELLNSCFGATMQVVDSPV